jgi:phenylalanyl-tRNA synthetase beta chain
MKVSLSWLRDFVDVPGTAEEIGAKMSVRGLALEGIETHGDHEALDFDVAANRPDCLSVRGIAREIATAYGLELLDRADRLRQGHLGPSPQDAKAEAGSVGEAPGSTRDDSRGAPIPGLSTIPVTIADPDLCGRYVAAIADVTIGPSPDWMQARLAASGVRPINNIVDITNYVLLELGQPMHAFDLARLEGPAIVVRRAQARETLTTLDGKRRTLDPDMLVIADARRASAIGGVMGGADSEVSGTTTQVVFESAWFDPPSVRATSRKLGLRTEASHRFERGADIDCAAIAMARALELTEAIGAGVRRGAMVDVYPTPRVARELVVDAAGIHRLLGMQVPDAETERILESLGFGVKALGGWHAGLPDAPVAHRQQGSSWCVTVPSWRVDVHRPVDLIEEVGRHHGFEHLPITLPAIEEAPAPSDWRIARDARIRRGLLAMGFTEAITFAFIESTAAALFLDNGQAVVLANPLSEKFTTLRPSLLPGLLDAVSHNRRHGRRDVRLFEIGTRFTRAGEVRAAAAIWTGLATADHWSGGRRDVDFFDVKGVAEQLAAVMAVPLRVVASGPTFLLDGQKAELHSGNRVVGWLGQLDPTVAKKRELPGDDSVFVVEVDLDALSASQTDAPKFATPVPRHPSVVRDVSILVDDILSAETVRDTIRAASPATLVDVHEFDRYQGKGIPDGKVSLALRLTFQSPNRTLTDTEVHAAMEAVVASLSSQLGAIQR